MDTGRFSPLYHANPAPLPEGDLPRLIKDVSKADAVLFPEGLLQMANVTDDQILRHKQSQMPQEEENINSMLGILNFFPVHVQVKYPSFDPYLIEGRYFASSFEPVDRAGGWVVMVPKKAAVDASEASANPFVRDARPRPPRRPGVRLCPLSLRKRRGTEAFCGHSSIGLWGPPERAELAFWRETFPVGRAGRTAEALKHDQELVAEGGSFRGGCEGKIPPKTAAT